MPVDICPKNAYTPGDKVRFFCRTCGKLLAFVTKGQGHVEILCERCKTLNRATLSAR